MKATDLKAVAYVTEGRVRVDHAQFAEDGRLIEATGTVLGTEKYYVAIEGEESTCTCPYGQAHGRTTRTHAHDQALRLQAQREQEGI